MKGRLNKSSAEPVYFSFNHVEGGRNVTFQNGTSDTITVEVTNQNIQRRGVSGATWSTPANGSTTIPVDAVKGIIGPNAFVRLSGAGTGSIYYAYTEKDDAADIEGVNINFNSQNYQLDGERFPLNEFLTITRSSVANSSPTSSGELVQYGVDELPFAWKPSVGKAGALFEGAATNLLTHSENFADASWTKSGSAAITPNTTTAPDGTLTADTLYLDASVSNSFLLKSLSNQSGAAGDKLSISVFTLSSSQILSFGGANPAGTDSVEIESFGSFYRQKITRTFSASFSDRTFQWIISQHIAGTGNFVIWGAQLETGTQPTSYIKTEATTASRAATNAVQTDLSKWGWSTAGGEVTLSAFANVGDVLFKAGSFEIIADVDGFKEYTASYAADPSATQIEVGSDCVSAVIFDLSYKPA